MVPDESGVRSMCVPHQALSLQGVSPLLFSRRRCQFPRCLFLLVLTHAAYGYPSNPFSSAPLCTNKTIRSYSAAVPKDSGICEDTRKRFLGKIEPRVLHVLVEV